MRVKWTPAIVAYLEFLVNLGLSAKDVAIYLPFKVTPNNVYRQVHRLGGSFRRVKKNG